MAGGHGVKHRKEKKVATYLRRKLGENNGTFEMKIHA